MNNVKRIFAGIFVCMFLCMNLTYVKAGESADVQNMAHMIMDDYKEALLHRDAEDVEKLLEAGSMAFCDYLEWRLAVMQILDVGYSDYGYTITDVNMLQQNEKTILRINYNETYTYSNGAGQGFSNGQSLCAVIEGLGADSKVVDLYLENVEFYDYFCERTDESAYSLNVSDSDLSNVLDDMINELYIMKEEMDNVKFTQKKTEEKFWESQETMMPYASTYYYSGTRGAAYANKYAAIENPYFYNAGADCTNFVSQCIWAGYGGWTSSMSDATIKSNIKNKVRMVSGTWFGGLKGGGGASAWENVDALWNFAVGNTGKEPKASGYNDGGYYTDVLPIDIGVGNVLQKSPDGSDYTHSMYVISTAGGSNPGYNEIIVAQHSSTKATATLAETITIKTPYLRQMIFDPNSFDS